LKKNKPPEELKHKMLQQQYNVLLISPPGGTKGGFTLRFFAGKPASKKDQRCFGSLPHQRDIFRQGREMNEAPGTFSRRTTKRN